MDAQNRPVIIVGGGPAGLMAAEILSAHGHAVTLYEKKPSVARKFLMAGRGGLNLTHSEDIEIFIRRYGLRAEALRSVIEGFTPEQLRAWCEGLGEKTFVGSSGRVFPESFKASPLLRAWLSRLEDQGVVIHRQHVWRGWNDAGQAVFSEPNGAYKDVDYAALFLALGGASWPGLGSDGAWAEILRARDIRIADFKPSNNGFVYSWSDIFRQRFAGTPLKSISLSLDGQTVKGEIMITEHGVEGGAVYALSRFIRQSIEENGAAALSIDLKPALSLPDITARLSAPRGRKSFTTYLQKTLSLSPVAIGLLREIEKNVADLEAGQLASLIKTLPLVVRDSFGIERAISSAGGVDFSEINNDFMLHKLPGVFVAGEMLDWEAPTGGYLLQASFATAHAAAHGCLCYLKNEGF